MGANMHTSERTERARATKTDLRRIQTAKATIKELAAKYKVPPLMTHVEAATVGEAGAWCCSEIERFIKRS